LSWHSNIFGHKTEIKNNLSHSRKTKSQIFNQSSELNSIKCHTFCKGHFSSFLFLYSCSSQAAAHVQTKTSYTGTYLTSWHSSIFGCKLRTD